jgi:hypothetical protein
MEHYKEALSLLFPQAMLTTPAKLAVKGSEQVLCNRDSGQQLEWRAGETRATSWADAPMS